MTVIDTTVAGLGVRLAAPSAAAPHRPWTAPEPGPGQDVLPLGRPAQSPAPRPLGTMAAQPTAADAHALAVATAAATALVEALQRHRRPQATWLSADAVALVAAWSRQRAWSGVRVARVRACRTGGRAVEAALVLADGREHFSVAVRLEHGGGRWVLTLVEVMLPPAALGMVA